MEEVRKLQIEIDEIDFKVVDLLRERFIRSRHIGIIKKREKLLLCDLDRVASQREQFIATCVRANIDPGMAHRLISLLIEQVIAERNQLEQIER
jgi:chorismate mutase